MGCFGYNPFPSPTHPPTHPQTHPGGGGGTQSEKGYELWSDHQEAVAVKSCHR